MTLDFAKDALKKDNDKAYLEYCENRDKELHFTKDELFFIEERCDIEASQCMNKFLEICKLEHPEKLSTGELNMLMKLTTELMHTYNILRQLRTKLEDFRKNEKDKN